MNAARMAMGLNARVTILDRSLDRPSHARCHTCHRLLTPVRRGVMPAGP